MDILSKRMRDLREDRDMLQGALAQALDLSQSAVSNYECGREPPLDVIFKYADYFGVSVQYLLGLTNEPHVITPSEEKDFDRMQREAAEHGDSAFSRADIARLASAFAGYYRAGAPAGSAPMDCVKAFLAAAPRMLEAAAQGDAAALLNACNDLARAGLDTTNVLAAVLGAENDSNVRR